MIADNQIDIQPKEINIVEAGLDRSYTAIPPVINSNFVVNQPNNFTKELDKSIIEYPLVQQNTHGQLVAKPEHSVSSKKVRSSFEDRTREATPTVQKTYSGNCAHNIGNPTGTSEIRYINTEEINQGSLRQPVRQPLPFSVYHSGFSNSPIIDLSSEQSNEIVTGATEESKGIDRPFICICDRCSKRTDFSSQINKNNRGISEGGKEILEGTRTERLALESETTGCPFTLQPPSIPVNYPELQLLLGNQSLYAQTQSPNIFDKLPRLSNPSTKIKREIIAPVCPDSSLPRVPSGNSRRVGSSKFIPVTRANLQQSEIKASLFPTTFKGIGERKKQSYSSIPIPDRSTKPKQRILARSLRKLSKPNQQKWPLLRSPVMKVEKKAILKKTSIQVKGEGQTTIFAEPTPHLATIDLPADPLIEILNGSIMSGIIAAGTVIVKEENVERELNGHQILLPTPPILPTPTSLSLLNMSQIVDQLKDLNQKAIVVFLQ